MPERLFAVATGNPHKIEEIQAVLGPLGIRVITADEAISLSGADGGRFVMPEETGTTFEENSRIKADALAAAVGVAGAAKAAAGAGHNAIDGFLADDSGLCVDALGGAPGVYSARYAEAGTGTDTDNTGRLLRELKGVPGEARTARFVCVITLIVARGAQGAQSAQSAGGGSPDTMVFRGECEGRITAEPRGHSGFGYDPVFAPEEVAGQGFVCGGRTFAELAPDEKNRISHRARALAELYAFQSHML